MGITAHFILPVGVIQQTADTSCNFFGITKRNEYPPSLGKQLLRMPVRGGDHSLPRTEHAGKRSGGHLGLVQVGGHVDIGCPDEFLQVFQGNKTVIEDDMILHSTILSET